MTESYNVRACENGFIIETCEATGKDVFTYKYKKFIFTDWNEALNFMSTPPEVCEDNLQQAVNI